MAKRRLSSDERRDRTLQRVTRVFAKKGFAETTSADLAKAAGISEGMLYKLFGSKRKLYQAMVEHKLASPGWSEIEFPSESASPAEFLRRWAGLVFERVEADPDFVRLLLYSDLQSSEFAALFHEALGIDALAAVEAFLRHGVEAGTLRAVDPGRSALKFLALAWQMALNTHLFKQPHLPIADPETEIDDLVALFLRGVQA